MDYQLRVTIAIAVLWTHLVTRVTGSEEAIYVGCYQDSRPPSFSEGRLRDDDMTHSLCFERCALQTQPYAGLRSSRRCSCGYDYDRYGSISEALCDSTCAGDESQTCGGDRANSVFLLVYSETICENQFLQLDCGDHFIAIHSALYGIDPAENEDNACNSRANNVCAAESSLSTVQDACQDRHTCEVPATNGVFGDPCPGAEKYLKVVYSCPKYDSNSPAILRTAGPLPSTTEGPGGSTAVSIDVALSTPGAVPLPFTTDGPSVSTAVSIDVPRGHGTADEVPYLDGSLPLGLPSPSSELTTIGSSDVTTNSGEVTMATTTASRDVPPDLTLACGSPTQVGVTMGCTLNMEPQGLEMWVKVDFGDGSSVLPTHLMAGRVEELGHGYGETGKYNITVVAADDILAVEQVTIMGAPCTLSLASIKGVSDDQSHPAKFLRASELRLSSSVDLSCSLYVELLFSWVLLSGEAEGQGANPLPPHLPTNNSQLVIPARSLEVGLYEVILHVTMVDADGDDLGQRSYHGWIQVTQSDLVALIEDGSQRTVGHQGSAFTLDGSSSYDPDHSEDRSALQDNLMVFSWSCLPASVGYHESVSSNMTCDGSTLGEDTTFSIDPGSIPSPNTIDIYLTIEKEGRTATTSQQIVLVAGDPPEISIRCLQNCGVYLQPSSNLVLHAVCGDCTYTPSYSWEFLQDSPGGGKVAQRFDWETNTLTGGQQEYLVLKSQAIDALTPGLYYLQVAVKHDGNTGRSGYSYSINNPPENGTCHFNPTNGTVLETQFIVTCDGFEDVDQPLTYSVYRTQTDGTDYLLSTFAGPVSPALYPPSGNDSDGHSLNLRIRISDYYGASTSTYLEIKVFPISVDSEGPLGDRLLNMSTGSASLLGNLITSGNKEAANQVLVSVATLLNDEPGNETGSLDKETRREIRSSLIESLATLDLQTAEDIEQSSASLGLITESSNELSQDTQVKAVDLISSMTSFMKQEISTKGSFSSQQVERSSGQLASGLSNVLGAAMVAEPVDESAVSDGAESQQLQRRVVMSVIDTIDVVQDILVASKIPGESETLVQTPSFSLSVSRQSANQLGDMQMSSPRGGGWFKLPQHRALHSNGTAGESHDAIDVQVVEMSDNPFSWGSNVTEVTSGVMGVQLKSDGIEIEVSGLENDDMSLMLQQPSSQVSDPEHFEVTAGSLVALSINGTRSSSDSDLVQITLLPSDLSATVYVCVLANYSTNIYSDRDGLCSQNFSLPRVSEVETASVESTYTWTGVIPQRDGQINLHVRAGDVPDPRDWGNGALNLSVYSSSPDCLFWDEEEEAWINRGCRIGPLSDPWNTHCLCNHLSYFGSSLLVRPNKIDLIGDAKLFLTFVDNPLVVCTVAVVFGVYLIIALWAWREDKRDLKRAQTTILEDNDPYDHYRYLITVVTGWRRGASTTANVTLTMHGTRGDSDSHVMESSEHPVFTAGSHDTFLLTTRETLGDVTDIRLWHDNAGTSPEWFVSRVQIHDLQTDSSFLFLCNSWLASTMDDGRIDRSFAVATEENLRSVGNLFSTKTSEDFQDGHLWFSVFTRPPRSSFTRVQRVSCCFSLLMTAMMTNIMFYGIPTDPSDQVLDFGAMRITIKEIIIGIEGAIIAFPINLIIVTIFRYARPPQSRADAYHVHMHTAEGSNASGKTPSSRPSSSFHGSSDMSTMLVDHQQSKLFNRNLRKDSVVSMKGSTGMCVPPGFRPINGDNLQRFATKNISGTFQDGNVSESSNMIVGNKNVKDGKMGSPESRDQGPTNVQYAVKQQTNTASKVSVDSIGVRLSQSYHPFLEESASFDSLPKWLVQGVIGGAVKSCAMPSPADAEETGSKSSIGSGDGPPAMSRYNHLLYTRLMNLVVELECMDPVCFSSVEEYQKALYEARALVLTAISVATPTSSSYDTSIGSLEGRVFSSEEGDSNWWLRKRPQQVNNSKRQKGLPHFFVYIGWLLLIVTCLGSAYVTMLYGLKYGLQRSLDWLVSLIISTVQSIFITQPLKIVLLAVFLSLVFRQWEEEEDGAENFDADIEEKEIDNAEAIHARMLQEKQADARYQPPPYQTAENHRLLKEKEHQMYELLREIVGYIFFIWLLLIITYSRRDRYAYHLTKNIKDRYFEGNKIYRVNLTHFKGFFEWSESVVVPNLYGTSDYEADTQSLLLGGVRIRQLRVRPDSCTLVKTIKNTQTSIPECWSPYSRLSKDTRSFNQSWRHPAAPMEDNPWNYQEGISLPYAGKITTYHKGGYVWYLGSDLTEAVNNMAEMKASRWLDVHTRAIFVDWTVYNGNINMFGIVTCLLEMPAGGGMLKSPEVHSVRLYRSSSNTGAFVTLCEAAFSIYLLYYMYREFTRMREQRLLYWSSIWNWLEVIMIINAVAMIALYIVQLVYVKRLFLEFRQQPGSFYDFHEGAMMENNLTYTSALLVILGTLKFLHLLRLNPRMYLLTSVIFRSASEVAGFMLLIFLLVCTFSLFLTLSVGSTLGSFRSFLASFVTLYTAIPGNFDAHKLSVAARYFGPFVVFTFQSLSYFLFMNLLISALSVNMTEVRQNPTMSEDGVMGLLLISKILSFFGIRKRVKLVP